MIGRLAHAEVRETVKAEQQPAQAAVLAGPWQQCSSSCGGGWQERAVLCAVAPGFLGEAWQCSEQGLTSTPTSTPCRCEPVHIHHSAPIQEHPCAPMCPGRSSHMCPVCASHSYDVVLLHSRHKAPMCTWLCSCFVPFVDMFAAKILPRRSVACRDL